MDKQQLLELTEKVKNQNASPEEIKALELPDLLTLSRRIKKYRKDNPGGEFRLAVLGSYSIQYPTSVLDTFLLGSGIDATIYEGEYDGIRMDVLDDQSELYRFAPNMVLLLMDHRDLQMRADYFSTEEEIAEKVNAQMAYFESLWSHLSKIEGCQILQTNIALPFHRALGGLEGSYPFTQSDFYRRINHEMAKRRPRNVSIIDMEYISSVVGKKAWFDYSSYFLTKTGFSMEYLGEVCSAILARILAMKGKVRKCLVLDLDNTLWGGVVGDDGWDKIMLDPHNAVGESYRYFQKYILDLKRRGVILAVCSKNEDDIAKEPFEKNPNMVLSLSDIACFVANWEDKAGNIRKIAKTLNIGVDSLVFIDDNPAEREIVRKFCPEVLVPALPEDPAEYATCIEESKAFEWAELTREDLSRSDSYAANRDREALMDSFVDYDSYLAALEMEAVSGEPGPSEMERFVQLINKSNQFNLRTKRYTQAQVESFATDENHKLLFVELSDKFSRYGIISCIILEKQGEKCFVDTWLMSCRVLKRGVEKYAMNAVAEAAKAWGCKTLVGEYIPTAKNRMVREFYPQFDFALQKDNGDEGSIYERTLDAYEPYETKIKTI